MMKQKQKTFTSQSKNNVRKEEKKKEKNDSCKSFCAASKRKIKRMAISKLFALYAYTQKVVKNKDQILSSKTLKNPVTIKNVGSEVRILKTRNIKKCVTVLL